MKIWNCLVLSALISWNCLGIELVRDGKACAEIVISENADPAVKSAALDLQFYLEKISGARLPVVTPSETSSDSRICVGESECTRQAGYQLPSFRRSGYDILVGEKQIILAGLEKRRKLTAPFQGNDLHPQSRFFTISGQEDDCGASHAVTAFLEHLGVRFYAPGEAGTFIPRKENISVSDFRETREAAFARRICRAEALNNDPDTAAWFRHLKCGSSLEPVAVFPLASVLKQCSPVPPEWIARDTWGRFQFTGDGCPFPRFTHSGFRQACVRSIRQVLDGDPSIRRLELVLPVLHGKPDRGELDSCLTKTVFPQPVISDILFSFYSAVAREVGKTHPDRILLCQVPNNTLPSPAVLSKIPKNLRIRPSGLGVTLYAAQKTRNSYLKLLSALAKLSGTDKMQQIEWWNEPACPDIPSQGFWFFHALQQIRQAQRPVIDGVVMDAGLDPLASGYKLAELPITHLMYYVNSKLLWEPDLDLNALLDEYCRLRFGPAAAEMKEFLRFAETLADRPARRSILAQDGQFRPEDVPVWFGLLDKARAKTPEGSVFRRRIESLENCFTALKIIFSPSPPAVEVQGSLLPARTVVDGDLSKYRNWTTLPGGTENTRTEFAIAATDDRLRLFVAFRCYEPEMKRLKEIRLNPDDLNLFASDHVLFTFRNSIKGRYFVAVDSSGNFADASSDPDDASNFGCPAGWNPAAFVCARRYDDRWEAEMEIDVYSPGKLPDYNAPWAVELDRFRTPGEIAQHRIASFTLPKINSAGQPVTALYAVLTPVRDEGAEESAYTVKHASGPVDLSAAWESPVWKDVPELRMNWEMVFVKSESKILPDVRTKIQYDEKYLYVLYQVRDQFVRGSFKDDQTMVCLDSCMEIFIQPLRNGPYYNFECNCIGSLLLYEATPQPDGKLRFAPIPAEEMKQIRRFSTLPRDLSGEITEPVVWRLGLRIPLDFFVRRTGVKLPLTGQVWYFNVYKCADWTSNPRWLMWKKAQKFHCPEGFGKLIFE